MEDSFSDIRPYYDHEVNDALKQALTDPVFYTITDYLFPQRTHDDIRAEYSQFQTLYDFQSHFAFGAVKTIIRQSLTELSSTGLEKYENGQAYLFMSNHRDIVLDPGLIGYELFTRGFQIPQMAIGSNLLVSPLVSSLFRLNKSFVVQRNESPRQMYDAWKKLSAYIYHVITERKENLWIAQREGRAKDGDDRTMTGILKMFLMNLGDDHVNTIRTLNIVPVTISYEYDPCDYLKALELYHADHNLEFKKDNAFNLTSMLTGIQGPKGRVHIHFGEPLSEFLHKHPSHERQSDFVKYVAAMIDEEIHLNYRLWPSNFIAHDLMTGTDAYASHYTAAEKDFFIARMEKKLEKAGEIKQELQGFMLRNYATCVDNHFTAVNAEKDNI